MEEITIPSPDTSTCVGLIPARKGSKRIPGKNIKSLFGHPLIAYTINSALQSNIFDDVIVSTNCEEIKEVAKTYGASVPFLRPEKFAQDESPDIEWVKHALKFFQKKKLNIDYFFILRPTNPFRKPETISRAWNKFKNENEPDSLRAVEKCKQHPAKMWRIKENRMEPIMKKPDNSGPPWYSMQYQSLPEIYVQNASLEIARSHVPMEMNSIAGKDIMPFITKNHEGFDINYPEDWIVAQYLVESNTASLPEISSK